MQQRLYRSFRRFIDHDTHFSESEQQAILNSFENPHNQRVFQLALILFFWAIIGISIDATLVGGGVVLSFIKGLDVIHFLPSIIFLLVNVLAKVVFVMWYTRSNMSHTRAFFCAVPYIGPLALLGFLSKDDPLFLRGVKHYIGYLKSFKKKNHRNK